MKLPRGFTANGVASGVKPSGLDLALLAAERPVPAVAVFTTSAAPAAPVQVSREHLTSGSARAVILNSGCANAATGAQGLTGARRTVEATAQELECDPTDVVVCSTGVIGTELPVEKIEAAVPALVAGMSPTGTLTAARAIMTTDTRPKVAVSGGSVPVVGIAKGAGMIRPHMATMLAVLTTDADVEAATLRRLLTVAVDRTFNSLTVDGCMSTNDTVVALASGEGGAADPMELATALEEVCLSLARQIAADGEGATKVVTIRVEGAGTATEARRAGLLIADSVLVRSSFAASDPNWGRVVAALGAGGIPPDAVSIAYAGVEVARHGESAFVDPGLLDGALDDDFVLAVDLGRGTAGAEVITCDLTPEYVVENMETS